MLGWSSLPPETRLAMRLLKYVRMVITTIHCFIRKIPLQTIYIVSFADYYTLFY